MKLAILGLVAVLILGGGAAGAYFYLAKPAQAAAGPQDEAAKAEHKAKSDKAAKDSEGSAAEFVQMEPLILPIIDESGVSQTIAIVISIEVPDTAAAEKVKHLMPRLKDAYIQDMYGTLSRETALQNGVLQVAFIKERLNRVSDKVVGAEHVSDVLLQVVHQNAL